MDMRLRPTDTLPTLDPKMPEMENAALRIALELELVRLDHPEMTPHEQLREARRRSATLMTAACDAIEARRAHRMLQEARERVGAYHSLPKAERVPTGL
jgi:hypothetical protein